MGSNASLADAVPLMPTTVVPRRTLEYFSLLNGFEGLRRRREGA